MPKKVIIHLENTSICHGEFEVLKDITLKIYQGELIYLVGKTGSGKTSFLKTLYGGIPLGKGKANILDFQLSKLNWKNLNELRKKMGIIFQDFNLLNDRSVDDNLKFVLKATGWTDEKAMEERILEVLTDVGLMGKGWKPPHQLSGGEQQRVVIARALLNRPQLILADEPTGNLDPETADDIVRLIRQVAKENNITIIFATHNYNIIETYTGRVIRCQGGQILDERNYLI